ncbi:hypothetical protein KFL_004260140, partial [Klebsormidium nitens]
EECRERAFLGTPQFAETGKFQTSEERAANGDHPPGEASSTDRCLPSRLLRAELERRDFNFPAAQVELFVEHNVNGCCEAADAVAQVQRWQVQKLQADARKRATASRRAANLGGGERQGAAGRETRAGCPLCGETGHGEAACPARTVDDGAASRGAHDSGKVCSAFVVSVDWHGRSAAIGDDADFWLAVDNGFEPGSRTELSIEWLSIGAAAPEVYVWEREDTEAKARRAVEGIRMEACEGGYRLPESERRKVLDAVEAFRARETLVEERERGRSLSDLCGLCEVNHGEEDEQVLCDGCDRGFHLECLDQAKIEYPDDVLEDGVEWLCSGCDEKSALSAEAERVSAKDARIKASSTPLKRLLYAPPAAAAATSNPPTSHRHSVFCYAPAAVPHPPQARERVRWEEPRM